MEPGRAANRSRSASRADGGSERSPLSGAAREAVVLGVNEARRAGTEHAGTGHLLLGLLEEGTGAGVRSIKRQGVSQVIISHRLTDIFEVGDRVMVLKRGVNAGERRVKDTTEKDVLELIVAGAA